MRKDNGGPAFPGDPVWYHYGSSGMSLRDWFAGMALVGEIATQTEENGVIPSMDLCSVAAFSYKAADAMLAERSKNDD